MGRILQEEGFTALYKGFVPKVLFVSFFLFSCTHLDFLFAFLVLLPLCELSAHPDLTRLLSPSTQILRLGPAAAFC